MAKTYADTLDEQAEAANRANWLGIDGGVITSADSYFITPEFQSLAFSAAAMLPTCSIEPQDMPSVTGWVSLGEPVRYRDVFDVDAVEVTEQRGDKHRFDEDMVDGFAWLPSPRHQGYIAVLPFESSRHHGNPGFFHGLQIKLSQEVSNAGLLIHFVKSLWLLTSQQNVSETNEEAPPRAARRRAERAGVAPLIRVIRLPRRVREQASAKRGAVDWQSRWIVRGHWRQQPWGPERKRIRPVWIAPHVKGPEDKPLKESAHRLFVVDTPEP